MPGGLISCDLLSVHASPILVNTIALLIPHMQRQQETLVKKKKKKERASYLLCRNIQVNRESLLGIDAF